MIICAVDDLLFSVKISTAAKSLNADVYFERSADRVVATVRGKRPSLVIFDLNSARMRPVELIAALKADPELAGIRTLGYVSHVDTTTIEAAKAAGIDEVMARSGFTAQLPEILRRRD
jgi:PleD family two-component response regulator